jgi:hypothetical protein
VSTAGGNPEMGWMNFKRKKNKQKVLSYFFYTKKISKNYLTRIVVVSMVTQLLLFKHLWGWCANEFKTFFVGSGRNPIHTRSCAGCAGSRNV